MCCNKITNTSVFSCLITESSLFFMCVDSLYTVYRFDSLF